MKKTATTSFGMKKRQSHDSSRFYQRSLYQGVFRTGIPEKELKTEIPEKGTWVDTLYCCSSACMEAVPENSVALAFTSPPYNVGKDYEDDKSLKQYLDLIWQTGREVYRVLRPGGRYVINVANLGRKPYIPLHSFFYDIHMDLGFLPMGEIIWRKAKGANQNCAWGSWKSAKAPRLRDIHEYLLVFAKQAFSRPDKGNSDIERDEFMSSTLSIWDIGPESARKIGHPAPFPVELASRVIKLYSYQEDVVLDPFLGSGTTCIAALKNKRHYIGFEISEQYCQLAKQRISAMQKEMEAGKA